jgi:hypothetical protein
VPEHRLIFSRTPRHAYSLGAGRNLYLDTSAIRRLGKRFRTSPRIHEIYTSVFTLIELLSDITKSDGEFRARRSAVAGIMASDVGIDWQMPDVRLRCAFEPLKTKYDIYESRVQCIQELLTCLAHTETLKRFRQEEAELRLEYGIEYFSQLDQRISETHIASSRKWVPHNRKQFREPHTAEFLEFLGLPRDTSIVEAGVAIGGSSFDSGLALYSLTAKFAEEEGQPLDSDFHDQLFRGYDNSLGLYVRASSFQMWREIGRGDLPGRNTAADLAHLEYVVKGSYVVTADDGMAAQILQAGGAVLSVEELDAG